MSQFTVRFSGLLILSASLCFSLLLVQEAVGAGDQATVVRGDLEWMAVANGEDVRWPDAVSFCQALELAGHDDWRLPSLDELEALHDPDIESGIVEPFKLDGCCLWSGESLVDRAADDGDGIAGMPGMYHWGFMFDGGLHYYAVHVFEDGQALCVREIE
jgi:hypothetical protein